MKQADGHGRPDARDESGQVSDAIGTAPAIVGIGASASGLRALEDFVRAISADSGMAYVVIAPLDAGRESRVAELLQERAAVPVVQVTGTTVVEADRVYVITAGNDSWMDGSRIRVRARAAGARHLPIDLFFGTLAESCGARAVGVVLSGTGSDGAAGIRQIKHHGGITAAQAPAEAEHDGMPTSAVETGQVDLVLPAARIPGELLRLRRMASPLGVDAWPPETAAQLAEVFTVLRDRTGHDFSQYKRGTVLRRLERRLRFNGAGTLETYLTMLRSSEAEARLLMRDLLISVSSFFRDPECFAALAAAVPALFEGKGPDDAVRVWVVGCATGEEAYSIAILLKEHAATLDHPPTVQIFATDIDDRGYAAGREALYPATSAADIPAERLERSFTKEPGGFRVRPALRESVLFAVHNVLLDPPFSRIDLVSCRNLLIYLQPEAQERAVATFHYALRTRGLLFLGASESAAESGLFSAVSAAHRLYRREESEHRVPPPPPALHRAPQPEPPPVGAAVVGSPSRFAYGPLHLRMLEMYAAASLVVDERLDLVHLAGRAGEYLRLGAGEPSRRLLELVHGDLRAELRIGLYQAFVKGLHSVRIARLADGRSVKLRVHAPVAGAAAERFALVVIDDEARASRRDVADERCAPSEAELQRMKEQLEATSLARDRMMDELRAINADLLSINEEQKAAAEELETSREEIVSINDELSATNQEHQGTIDELQRTNADLTNLVRSTEIATVFLDAVARIRRFTPAAESIFNFTASDVGRPLADITHRLRYAEMSADIARVVARQERVEREVAAEDGRWYIVRINPYHSADGVPEGAVVTCFDNSVQKRVEANLREATRTAESANRIKSALLATLSHEFRNPISGMILSAEVLERSESLPDELREKVAWIRSCGWHLASMVDEILTFAKLDEGLEIPRYQSVDARSIVHESRLLAEPAAAGRGLSFRLSMPAEEVPIVTDAAKVRQILCNLCGNAVRYTERGEIVIGVRAHGERVVFEVRDTGIGISVDDQRRIFERFWRVPGASGHSSEGLGIGLAAVREFSQLLGGDVEVVSEPGQGSTFRVSLPARPGPPAVAHAAPAEAVATTCI
jgi:two-component system, chemotaxis family, CheB/CheR fusion protein